MERLAWVEILDRHGDVSSRHPVHAWPLKVGRAYTSDIVLDDPYVAADHLEINPVGDGTYQFKVVNSVNAMTIDTLRGKQTEASISAKQLVRIGHTQFRIRPIDYAVSPEKPMPSNAWSRSWPALFVGVTVLILTYLLTQWLNYDRDEGYRILLLPVVGAIALLLLWVGFWALIGRVLSGRANFIAHTVNASLGISLFIFLNVLLYGYMDFVFDFDLMTNVLPDVLEPLIIGILLFRHIGLVSRMSRRRLGMIVVALMASLIGFGYVTEKWNADNNITSMSFSRTIGPPFMLLAHGKSTEAFIAGAGKLKSKVDE
jgi:hypothetical protein